jgi:hypothetical protein
MPTLTRHRSNDPHREGWIVLFGDVEVGRIGRRSGVPPDADQWGWSCGFYPGCEPGEYKSGSTPDFFTARHDFESAWHVLSARRTEEDYEAWRKQRAFCAWKEQMWALGCRLPTQEESGWSRCFCGVGIDLDTMDRHIRETH